MPDGRALTREEFKALRAAYRQAWRDEIDARWSLTRTAIVLTGTQVGIALVACGLVWWFRG